MASLVIDIGGTKCAAAISDSLENRFEILTKNLEGPSEILSKLSGWAKNSAKASFDSVAVSFGGPFDFIKQKVMRSIHVSGWEGFSFRDWSEKEFGISAVADNDANLGALGEWVVREKSPRSLVYVTISTGIGSGIVLDGKLYRGATNLAGELGHTVVDPAGPEDELGNRGTLERYCAGYWLQKDYGVPASQLLEDDEFLSGYCQKLAIGLSNLVRTLNPELLVLGGGVSNAGARLESGLLENMSKLLSASGTRMEISKLSKDNVLIGARELALHELRG